MSEPHVFVVMGDITRLVCDAWLIPGDTRPNISEKWRHLDGLHDHFKKVATPEFMGGEDLVLPAIGWTGSCPGLPILGPVRGKTQDIDEHLLEVVAEFIRVGAQISRESPSSSSFPSRSKPLLAVPLLGVDRGGRKGSKGKLIERYLDVLEAGARRYNVDIAFVFFQDRKSYAFAQQIRRKKQAWSSLTEGHVQNAKLLASYARGSRLVPFLGSGIGISSGLPDWKHLLSQLAARAGASPEQIKALIDSGLDSLDQATYIQSLFERNENGSDFRESVAELVSSEVYGLTPSLISSLAAPQAITMNYDDLYESAYEATGKGLSVMPAESITESDNWLLKLHGSIDVTDSIVLTRDDYLGYNASRETLSALVKANLITHHLLFVGFGLTDPHFHQIMHDVKRALPGMETSVFASAVTLSSNTHLDRLWSTNLRVMPMIEGNLEGNIGEASRLVEIFLDALGAYAADIHEYLLDDDYSTGLSPDDLALKQRLLELETGSGHELLADGGSPERSSAWERVAKMLHELGRD